MKRLKDKSIHYVRKDHLFVCDECKQGSENEADFKHEPDCKSGQQYAIDQNDLKAFSPEQLKAMFPRFGGDVRMAVFNIHRSDEDKARKAVIEEFGQEAWDTGVKPFKRTGIMELFHHDPTPILTKFAVLMAVSVEARITKREAAEAKASAAEHAPLTAVSQGSD